MRNPNTAIERAMNKTSEYSLTIVVPVFNEKDNIHNLEKALTAFHPAKSKPACCSWMTGPQTAASP